jgi:membrane glycosyltransferase
MKAPREITMVDEREVRRWRRYCLALVTALVMVAAAAVFRGGVILPMGDALFWLALGWLLSRGAP